MMDLYYRRGRVNVSIEFGIEFVYFQFKRHLIMDLVNRPINFFRRE